MSLKLADRIRAFSLLGSIMKEACEDSPADMHAKKLSRLAAKQYRQNPWFTKDNVIRSIAALAESLNAQSLEAWLEPYSPESLKRNPKRVGLIMAGNIPLVGFHDFLSVLISGNILLAKSSSKDRELIENISEILTDIEPGFKEKIFLSNKSIKGADAVIATGSNNTARYFEYYYAKLPHIFRKNRNSIAIIHPGISDAELRDLGKDVFYYYGLGCRNVSRLCLPGNFDLNRFAFAWQEYASVLKAEPYLNNYTYNRALYRLEGSDFLDLDYFLLKKDNGYSSPVSVLYYSYYNTRDEVEEELSLNHDKIQTIVSKNNTPFGQAQNPALNDYADGVDTIDFLLNL